MIRSNAMATVIAPAAYALAELGDPGAVRACGSLRLPIDPPEAGTRERRDLYCITVTMRGRGRSLGNAALLP